MIFRLSKQHKWDHITGLLLIYPLYMLHIIEVSVIYGRYLQKVCIFLVFYLTRALFCLFVCLQAPRDILTFILRNFKVEEQQPEG